MNLVAAATTGGNYVAVLAIYLAIMANKLAKMQRTVSEIRRKSEESQDAPN